MLRDPQLGIRRSKRPRACLSVGSIALACLLIAARPGGATVPGSGLVVEYVNVSSVALAVGLQPGDLLVNWTYRPRDPSEGHPQAGTLATLFDLTDLFYEAVPHGEVILEGWRQGRAFTWTLRSTGGLYFGLQARPVMDLDHWERYHQALREISAAVPGRDPPPASLGGEGVPSDSPRLAAWYRLRYAEVAYSSGLPEAADQAFGEASEILLRASDPSAQAEVLRWWARYCINLRKDSSRAIELYEQAFEVERQRDCAGLSRAFTQVSLGWLYGRDGDLVAAERAWLEALKLEEKLVPVGLEVARALNNLGYLALGRGDTRTAQERLNRSEALIAQIAPGSPDHGFALVSLAETLIHRGELAAAEDLLLQSAEMFDRSSVTPSVAPPFAAGPHAILGMLAIYRGDLAAAQSYFELAVSRLRQAPETRELAGTLAGTYSHLAEVARRQRRFAEARTWEKEALAILERLAVGGPERAALLQEMARIELDGGGDLAAAEAFLRQAEALVRAAMPESPEADDGIQRDFGRLLVQRGQPAEAEGLFRQILSNNDRRGLASAKDEAEIRHLLGSAQRRRGNLAAAEASFCRVTELLDLQRSRLGGSLESRSWFESETHSYFFDCLSALMDRGRPAEAFHTLERGKNRVFLELLAERDLRLEGLPPELKAERARLDAEYDLVQARLLRLGSDGKDEMAALQVRLEEIKAGKEALVARLRLQSPRLAALQAPAPLDLAGARRALDHGTVLLAYAVGPEESYLFVVRPEDEDGDGLEVHRLPINKLALEKEIEDYRRLLTVPRGDLGNLNARASRLYTLLLRPAEKRLAGAERILISADGPLHLLPWAALRRGDQYLVEWRPVHLIASATVYAQTMKERHPAGDPGTWRLVAFGDPRYPKISSVTGETVADSEVRSALRRGLHLKPLPATREEIRGIAELFPAAEVYLGEEATEERAKTASPHADFLHLAGHGLINERFPLDSALALTIPMQLREGQDNGLLQAWEIFENVRLDAHLVTLSACDTALGREMGGEGLLGLTRAFQFAGARSVLASLWSVSDHPTAMLMKRFYAHLRQGKTKDEALRAAQLDLIGSKKKSLSHPYYWAAFSLYGDWR